MKGLYIRLTLVGLLASTSAACSSQASLSAHQPQNAVDAPAAVAQNKEETSSSINQTVTRLRGIKTESGDPRVPPDAKQLLTTLKHQLRDLIHNTLNANNQQVNSRRLQAEILATLKRGGVKVEEPEEIVVDGNYVEPEYVQEYGNIYRIVIQRPSKHNNLLVATTTLSIPCGTDTSLYIFRNSGGRWNLTLARESDGYGEVSGAQGAFGYAISPPDAQNNFFVVTANINPWCTSNWQSIRYAVLREGQSTYEPRVILNQEHTIFRDHDPPFSIQVTANSFTLSFDGGEAMERMNNGEDVSEEEAKRSHIERYRIEGDQVKRIS